MTRDSRPVLIGCYLAMLSVGDNSTAIMAALPTMTHSLRLGSLAVEWVVNAYLLAAAIFIILGGDAADRFGERRSSTAGVALFALASLIIAVAPSGLVVVAARALQGLGAAFAVAGTLAAATEASTEADRAASIGAWTGFLMLGFSVGPLVGGVLTHYLGWRYNFWLNVLAMVPAALMLGLHPDGRRRQTRKTDWLGLGLLAIFMVTLTLGLQALRTVASAPLPAIVPLVLGAIAFAMLVWVETRCQLPLVDFSLFAKPDFALASILVFLLMFDIITFLLYYNLFAQASNGLGMSAVIAGVSLVPLSVALFAFARAAPRCQAAVGLRPMLVGGSLLMASGYAIIWASETLTAFTLLTFGLLVVGAGIALPYATAPRVGLNALPRTQAGKGSGMLNSCSFLGGTVGATFGGIAFALAGFPGVLALLGISALTGAAFSLRLRPK